MNRIQCHSILYPTPLFLTRFSERAMKTISEIVDPSAWFDLLNFSEGAWVFLEGKEKNQLVISEGNNLPAVLSH